MSDKGWKQAERRVAKLFGTSRTPLSGGNDKRTRSDSLHPSLFIESKQTRKGHSAITLYFETAKLAHKEKKIPVVVLTDKRGSFLIAPLDKETIYQIAGYMVSLTPEPPHRKPKDFAWE